MFDRDAHSAHASAVATMTACHDRRVPPQDVVASVRVTATRLVKAPLTCTSQDVRLMVVAANLLRIAQVRHLSWDLMTALDWGGQFIEPLISEAALQHRVEHVLVLIAEHLAAQRMSPPGTVVHDLVADPCGAWAEQVARGAATHYMHLLLQQGQCDHRSVNHLGEEPR